MNPDPILPVVLTVTVYPPKKNKRMVVVSGAPEGEMPLVLTGLFQERHALLDQAYAQCMKRKPQLVTTKEDKRKQKSGVQFGPGGTVEDDDSVTEQPENASDQLVSDDESTDADAESVPVSPIIGTTSSATVEAGSLELPAIDGDTAAQDDAQRFEAALEDLKAETEEGDDNA